MKLVHKCMHKYLDIVIVLNHIWTQSLGCLHFTLAGMTNTVKLSQWKCPYH
jgi:hypothetical protein